MLTFYFLRHGEVEGEPSLLGKTDRPCTNTGIASMHKAVKDVDVDNIMTSPRIRCLQFAQEFSKKNNIPYAVDERLQEVDFGDWDGLPLQTFWSEYEAESNQYFANPFSVTPPNGEETHAFVERTTQCLHDCITEYFSETQQFSEKKVLVVAHGGVIKTMLAQTMHLQADQYNWFSSIKIDYASLSSVSYWRMPVEHQIDAMQSESKLSICSMINYINR